MPGPPSLARRDLHVGQAQLAEDLDLVGLAERDAASAPGDDEQRVLLQVPEHVALLGQLVERVAHAVELEREVRGIHRLAVDAEAQRARRTTARGCGTRAGSARARARRGAMRRLDSSMSPLGMVRVLSVDGSGSDAAAQSSPSAILAHEGVLSADLLDRAPGLALALVLAGEVAGVPGILQRAAARAPTGSAGPRGCSSMSWNFAWMNTTYFAMSAKSAGSTPMPSRNAGRWPGSSPGSQRDRAVLEDAGVDQEAEVLRAGALDELDVARRRPRA